MESKEYKKFKRVEKISKINSNCIEELCKRSSLYIRELKIIRGTDTIITIDLCNMIDDISLGTLTYVLVKNEKDLFINHIERHIKTHPRLYTSDRILLKLTDLFIYKLIIDNHDMNTIYLYASSDTLHLGKEFCLMCHYEKIGFTQYDKKEYKKVIYHCKKELRTNNKNLTSQERDELYNDLVSNRDMCLLCKCQKASIDLTSFDLNNLSLKMEYVLDNIEKLLKDICRKIC
jgi:hypothetical protein